MHSPQQQNAKATGGVEVSEYSEADIAGLVQHARDTYARAHGRKGESKVNSLANVSDKALLEGVRIHQDAQKRFPPTSAQWKLASMSLAPLFRELERRERETGKAIR